VLDQVFDGNVADPLATDHEGGLTRSVFDHQPHAFFTCPGGADGHERRGQHDPHRRLFRGLCLDNDLSCEVARVGGLFDLGPQPAVVMDLLPNACQTEFPPRFG
jgi:hypothetical protein